MDSGDLLQKYTSDVKYCINVNNSICFVSQIELKIGKLQNMSFKIK